jgi:hypothetical protein
MPFEPHPARKSNHVGTSNGGSESLAPEVGLDTPTPGMPTSDMTGLHPGWQIDWTSECGTGDTIDIKSCVGAYGFSLQEDGAFDVGPGPNGQKHTGHLSTEDQGRIREELKNLSKEHGKLPECENALEPSTDQPRHFALLQQEAEHDLRCVDSIRALVHSLAIKYTPAAFPNPCTDAVWELGNLFDAIRECSSDADCEILDQDFKPTSRPGSEPYSVATCEAVPELKVGNGFRAVSWQLELILKREIAREVCTSSGLLPGCTPGTPRFEALRAPRCIQNRCGA